MCDKCDKKGPTSQYNGDKMQYSCDRCCFHTTRQSSLTKHMLSHENKGTHFRIEMSLSAWLIEGVMVVILAKSLF